ncbi:hypothetical protein [Mycobacterium sp. URHB0021]
MALPEFFCLLASLVPQEANVVYKRQNDRADTIKSVWRWLFRVGAGLWRAERCYDMALERSRNNVGSGMGPQVLGQRGPFSSFAGASVTVTNA